MTARQQTCLMARICRLRWLVSHIEGLSYSEEDDMFSTRLSVSHIEGRRWTLNDPLVWAGKWELMVVRSGFETDFASIPNAFRWFLDNAGANSEAAVLHDAVWRESQRDDPRVDPADADGIFRRALRETGSTALTRGLMWGAVRAAAIAHGRFGKKGPPIFVKLFQLVGILILALVTALPATVVVVVGLVIFWVANWIIAVLWRFFEVRTFEGFSGNWPWRPGTGRSDRTGALPRRYFEVFPADSATAIAISGAIVDARISDERLGEILDQNDESELVSS